MSMIAASGKGRVMAAINVTPMADIMIVLLIIFMVITPLLDDGGVRLPTASNAAVLTVADLARDLRDVLASRAEKTVLVRASGGVRYARVVDVLDAARGAGPGRIGLVPDGVVTPPAPGR